MSVSSHLSPPGLPPYEMLLSFIDNVTVHSFVRAVRGAADVVEDVIVGNIIVAPQDTDFTRIYRSRPEKAYLLPCPHVGQDVTLSQYKSKASS